MQYADNKASAEEVEEMLALLKSAESDDALKDLIFDERHMLEKNVTVPGKHLDQMWPAIMSATTRREKKQLFSNSFLKMAASFIIFIAGAGIVFHYFSRNKKIDYPVSAVTQPSHPWLDIPPGTDKALLKLANGTAINLDSLQNGVTIQQGNAVITKLGRGLLAYKTGNENNGKVLYNTITTPAGGKYEILLSDGSKVWLNAASSLHFPAIFGNKERTVELKGEAYFEAAHAVSKHTGKRIPFHVKANDQDVEVLGTHFNIMAYANEQHIETTLLEGKVKVTRHGITKILLPGQEAIADNKTPEILVTGANTETSVGWKNGFFHFRETNIRDLMRQAERWYNVEVEYRTDNDGQDFTGIVPRTKNISALLQTLELTGTVHFQVVEDHNDGHNGKIIVLP